MYGRNWRKTMQDGQHTLEYGLAQTMVTHQRSNLRVLVAVKCTLGADYRTQNPLIFVAILLHYIYFVY